MLVCPWPLSPSGEDLAFCSLQMFSACVCCACWLYYTKCLSLCASVHLSETEIDKQRHSSERDYICLWHTHTYVYCIRSPSVELCATNRSVRPCLTPCLWCETKTNYIAAVLSRFSHFITAVIKVLRRITFNSAHTVSRWLAGMLWSQSQAN